MSEVLKHYGSFVEVVYARLMELVRSECSHELQGEILYHLETLPQSKGLRPALVKAATEISGKRYPAVVERDRAVAVALVHEATLIVDDIIDESPRRRGQLALHAKFDGVSAGAAAAELNTLANFLLDDDPDARRLLRITGSQIAIAETLQQRGRLAARPFPLNEWQRIAMGDTGALFGLAMGLGGIEPVFCWPLVSLAYLRHGLDDIDDILDRGGDQADVRDHVPTLLACFAKDCEARSLKAAIPAGLKWLRPHTKIPRPYGRPEMIEPLEPFIADFSALWVQLNRRFSAASKAA